MKRRIFSVFFALVLVLSMSLVTAVPVAAVPVDGTGACTVTPLQVVTGSEGNELTFTFATGDDMSGGAISITAPANWSAPQGSKGTAGYTTATSSGTIGELTFTDHTVTVPVTSFGDMGGTITVVYGDGGGDSGAEAQNTDGPVEFTTKSDVDGIDTLEPIPDYLQPTVTVGSVALDAPYYEPGDTVTVTVFDSSANTHSGGIDSVEVTAENNLGDFVEEGVVLEETGVNTGVFTGSFGTSAVYPAPEGQLYVEDYEEFDAEGVYIPDSMVNDIITVTYGSHTATAAVNNDWPEVSMALPAEVTKNDPGYTDAPFSFTLLGEGLGSEYTSVIFAITIDASAALKAGDVLVGQTPEEYTIPFVEVGGNLVGYWGSPVSPISMPDTPGIGFVAGTLFSNTTTFKLKIVDGPVGTYTVTVDLLDLGFPEEGGVAYHGGIERHVLAWVSDTFEVVAAEPLMVSISPKEVLVKDVTTPITVTFQGSDFEGPDGTNNGSNKLDTVKVTLSGLGVDLASGDYYYDTSGQNEVDGTGGTETTLTFSVTPEQAGTITVEVVGTFDAVGDDPAVVIPKTLFIDVTGFAVEETWADVGLGTTGAISMTVTTKVGAAVNTGIVTITAPDVGGFEKNVDGIAGDESFETIVINGSTGEITYGGVNPEDFLVSNGYYEVTGITFVEIGDVEILVQDAGGEGGEKAHFLTAFEVLGIAVYDLSFEPATLTAGVDLAALAITITEAGVPVTDVHTITIGTTDYTPLTPVVNVYTVDPELVSIEDTLDVMAKNADETKYGTDTLEVGLPTVSYVITDDTEAERNCMLVGAAYDYTIAVTVLDAQGEPLALGKVWLGTINPTTGLFTALGTTGSGPADAMPLVLDADGLGDLVIAQDGTDLLVADTTLVWKVGDAAAAVGTAALLSTPSISVETPEYTLDWTFAPIVGDPITFTVTDNYGDPAGDIDIQIVSPGGVLTERVTTPTGNFKYTATEDGDYYVSVGEQDPVTVTVVITRLASIAASPPSVPLIYVGETAELTIMATYEEGPDADVTTKAGYESSDETVVAIVEAGLITAVAEGEATISVSYTEGVITEETTVLVTVTPVPVLVSIAAAPEPVSLNPGDTQQLTITATYSDETDADVTADATYLSSDGTVATVSDAGVITAVALGDATITVTYETKTADVLVTVEVIESLTIQLYEGANPILYTGVTMDLPGALTNISELTEIIWQRDVSTGGAWWSYLVVLDYGEITQLENDTVYIIVVSEEYIWELAQ